MLEVVFANISIEYIEGQVNAKGEERRAELVCGNPLLIASAIDRAKTLEFPNASLNMVYRDNKSLEELGGDAMVQEFITLHKACWTPDIDPDLLNDAYVLHFPKTEDGKEGTEINYIIAQIFDDKKLMFHDFYGGDLGLRTAFSKYWHALHPEFTNPDSSPQYCSYKRTWGKDGAAVWKNVNSLIHDNISDLNSKEEVVDLLKENGYEATLKKKYIKLKVVDNTIRLEGRIMQEDFDFKPLKPTPIVPVSSELIEKLKTNLDKEVALRKERLEAKYPELYQQSTLNKDIYDNKENNTSKPERSSAETSGNRNDTNENPRREASDYPEIAFSYRRSRSRDSELEEESPKRDGIIEEGDNDEHETDIRFFKMIREQTEEILARIALRKSKAAAPRKSGIVDRIKGIFGRNEASPVPTSKPKPPLRSKPYDSRNATNDAAIDFAGQNIIHLMQISKLSSAKATPKEVQDIAIFYSKEKIAIASTFESKSYEDVAEDYRRRKREKEVEKELDKEGASYDR